MPSHSPHASRPSSFRAPGWGAPALPVLLPLEEHDLAGVGAFQPSLDFKDFHQAARLHSLTNGHPGDHQFDGGDKQVGLRPLPRPQLQGSSSSLLGRRAGRAGACFRVGWRPASSSGIRGRKTSSSSAEEASSSHAGEGELLLLGQGTTFCPPFGRLWPAAPGGRTTRRTPRGRYSCSGTVPFSFSFSWRERE
jgi:hypothetical protein